MPWSAWSECSAPCDAGVQTRSRTCTPPAFGGAECTGPHLQTRNCNTRPCGGECHVGHGIAAPALTPALHPLSPAAQCPDTMQYLTAEECRHSEGRCPWICQDLGAGVACTAQCQPGCHCPAGLLLQNGTCVPPSHCLCHHRGHLYQPGDITALDTCNNWCGGHWGWGLGGSPHLHLCLPPLPTAPVWPGRWCAAQRPAQVALSGSCREEGVLLVPGGLGAVTPRVSPVPCTWSNWTAWSTCSHSCDVGMRRRYRVPIVPPLAGGGPPCQGPSMEVEFCSLQPCRGERFPLQGPWGGSHGMGVLREGAVGWASLERVPLSRCHGVGTPREGVTGCVPWGGCP